MKFYNKTRPFIATLCAPINSQNYREDIGKGYAPVTDGYYFLIGEGRSRIIAVSLALIFELLIARKSHKYNVGWSSRNPLLMSCL